MKSLMSLLFACLMASAAFAGLDSGTDSFGFYFDTAGNTNCITAEAMRPITAYLLLMNPVGPTDGFECSLTMTGAAHFVLGTGFGVNCIDDGSNVYDDGTYYIATGCATEFPVPETGAVVLMTWLIMLHEPSELLIRIGPGLIPSLPGGLPVLSGVGGLRLGAVAAGDINLPVAGINAANCPVSVEINAFGAVKSLFR